MAKRRYSLLRANPSSNTTMLATTSVPWLWLMSKHSIRSGASTSESCSCNSLIACERAVRSEARLSLCWAKDWLALRATVSISARLSPRCGTRMTTRLPRLWLSHSDSASTSAGSSGTRTSRGMALPAPSTSLSSP